MTLAPPSLSQWLPLPQEVPKGDENMREGGRERGEEMGKNKKEKDENERLKGWVCAYLS